MKAQDPIAFQHAGWIEAASLLPRKPSSARLSSVVSQPWKSTPWDMELNLRVFARRGCVLQRVDVVDAAPGADDSQLGRCQTGKLGASNSTVIPGMGELGKRRSPDRLHRAIASRQQRMERWRLSRTGGEELQMQMARDEAGCRAVEQILFARVSYTMGSSEICVSARQAFRLARTGLV